MGSQGGREGREEVEEEEKEEKEEESIKRLCGNTKRICHEDTWSRTSQSKTQIASNEAFNLGINSLVWLNSSEPASTVPTAY